MKAARLAVGALLATVLVTPGLATRYAGDFEELGTSARAIGMGGAVVAIAGGPTAIYYNPARTSLAEQTAAFFLHSEDFSGLVQHNFIGMSFPQELQSIGFAVLHNGIPGIKLTALPDTMEPPSEENRPYVTNVVSANQLVGYVNYSRRFTPHVSLGANAKLIYQSLGAGSSFGMGIDAGLGLTPGAGIDIGIRVRNASTSPLFWDTGTRELIMPKAAVGVGKTFDLGRDALRLALEVEGTTDDLALTPNLGVEYSFRNVLHGRLGMHRGNFTFGLGARYKRFYIDYGYASGYAPDARELGSAQQVSGGVEF